MSSEWVASCGASLAKRGARSGGDLLGLRLYEACMSWDLGPEALEDEGHGVEREDEEEGVEEEEKGKLFEKVGDADAVGL